ncbi:AAA family ATPase [Puniceicoccales bacterium CK1056]|uniref:AAA family ATPase n=1 Tax=Oceanipulchritudo coccoides TaxID=2706888 RepID=A0A6B2M0G4_9BACT|nr:AAA family ATPase [Oceanipulchritudo coccoides]NDV61255.1 AAA family ATPase [Oceanipulchritudo coccoides]
MNAAELTLEALAATGETAESKRLQEIESRLELLKEKRFDPNKPPKPKPAILTLNGHKVLTEGNICGEGGQAGTAKSHQLAAIMACTMAEDPSKGDFLGWHCRNPEGKLVLYIDAEQSEEDFHSLLDNAMRRAGARKLPEWLHAYNMTGEEPEAIKAAIQDLTDFYGMKGAGVQLALLDGYADLLRNGPNDETESKETVRWLMALARKHATGIFGVQHYNAQADGIKMRGHFGSELERKAQTVLALKRDNADAVTVYATKTRGRPIPEREGSRFAWDEDAKMFLSVANKGKIQSEQKTVERAQLVKDALRNDCSLSHTELTARIAELEHIKTDAAKKRISTMRKEGFLQIVPATGFYTKGGNCE